MVADTELSSTHPQKFPLWEIDEESNSFAPPTADEAPRARNAPDRCFCSSVVDSVDPYPERDGSMDLEILNRPPTTKTAARSSESLNLTKNVLMGVENVEFPCVRHSRILFVVSGLVLDPS